MPWCLLMNGIMLCAQSRTAFFFARVGFFYILLIARFGGARPARLRGLADMRYVLLFTFACDSSRLVVYHPATKWCRAG